MKCAVFLLAILLTGAVSAQITDPDQRMYWFNLQRLAAEAAEIEACNLRQMKTDDFDWQVYYRAAAATNAAIEAYVRRYPEQGRGENEPTDAYRYRVWQTTILAGHEKARSGDRISDVECNLIRGR